MVTAPAAMAALRPAGLPEIRVGRCGELVVVLVPDEQRRDALVPGDGFPQDDRVEGVIGVVAGGQMGPLHDTNHPLATQSPRLREGACVQRWMSGSWHARYTAPASAGAQGRPTPDVAGRHVHGLEGGHASSSSSSRRSGGFRERTARRGDAG